MQEGLLIKRVFWVISKPTGADILFEYGE